MWVYIIIVLFKIETLKPSIKYLLCNNKNCNKSLMKQMIAKRMSININIIKYFSQEYSN